MLGLMIVVAVLIAGIGGHLLARGRSNTRTLVGAGLLLAAAAVLWLEVVTGDARRVVGAAVAAFVVGSVAAWIVTAVKAPEPQSSAPAA